MENYVIRFDETRITVEMLEGIQGGKMGFIVSYVASQIWDNDAEAYVDQGVAEDWVRSLSVAGLREILEEITEQMKTTSFLGVLLEGLG